MWILVLAFIHCDHRNGFTPIKKALVSVVSGDLLFHRQVELQQKYPVVNHYTVNTFPKLPVMNLNDKHPCLSFKFITGNFGNVFTV